MGSLARSATKIALQHRQEGLQLLPQLGLQLLLPLFAATLGAASRRGMDFLGRSAHRVVGQMLQQGAHLVWNRSLVRIRGLLRRRFALHLAVASPRGTDCKARSAAARVVQDCNPLEPSHPRTQLLHSLVALCSLLVCNLLELNHLRTHLPQRLAVLCLHPRTQLNPLERSHPRTQPPHFLVALCPRSQPYNLVFHPHTQLVFHPQTQLVYHPQTQLVVYHQQLMCASLGPDPT